MNACSTAQTAYADSAAPIRTDRATEYNAFAQVTQQLKAASQTTKSDFARLADSLQLNHRLWNVLTEDLVNDDNALPIQLRADLISLAGFVRRHTHAVLSGKGTTEPLIDINVAIMKGLRSNGQHQEQPA